MKIKFGALIKKELFFMLISPSVYASILLFVIGSAVNFFIGEHFFTIGLGSSDLRFFFGFMPYVCILVIPSLTLNLWQHEHDSDSLPYTSLHIILAKFTASSLFFTAALLISLIVPLCASFFADIDTAQLISGFSVMLLCVLSYISLALCISLLLVHQIASFLVTSVILFTINTVHLIPLYTHVSTSLSNIINVISFAWHFDAAGKGILDSRDIIFYLMVIAVCIAASVCIKEKRKGKRFSFTAVFLSILSFILILITSSLYYIRIDTTKAKLFSVSKISEQVISEAEETIQIRYYVSEDLTNLYPQVRNVKDFLRTLALRNKKVSVEILDPDKEGSIQKLTTLGVQSQQIQTVKGNATSFTTVYSSIVIEYLNNFAIIPFILSAETLEFDIITRIDTLLRGYSKTVYLLEGTDLSLETDFSYVVPWLENSGYETIAIEGTLESFMLESKNPLVVIGSQFDDTTVQKIENFIMNGGRALFYVSKNKTNIIDWISYPLSDNNLLSMLSYWGFSLESGLLMDIANYRITMQSSDGNSYDYINYPLWITILPRYVYKHPVTESFSGLELYWASPLSVFSTEQSTISVLAESSEQSFIQKPFLLTNSSSDELTYETDPYSLKTMNFSSLEKHSSPVFAMLEGTVPGYYTTLRSPFTKIALIPDQYAVSNMVEYTNSAHNLDFLINTILYLSDNENLLLIKNKKAHMYNVAKIIDEQTFMYTKTIVYLVIFIVLPCIILFVPVIVYIRRKKHA